MPGRRKISMDIRQLLLYMQAADMFRLALQNLFDQIVQHETVAAGK